MIMSSSSDQAHQTLWKRLSWSILAINLLMFLGTAQSLSRIGPTPPAVAFFSSVCLACCLTGGWLGFGTTRWRWGVVLLLPFALGYSTSYAVGGQLLGAFQLMTYGITVVIAGTTGLLRKFKGELKRLDAEAEFKDGLQFGIVDLLTWTGVAAVLLAFGKLAFQFVGGSARDNPSVIFGGFALALGVMTSLNLWAFFGKEITTVKSAMLFGCTFGIAILTSMLIPEKRWFFPCVAILCETTAVALMFTMRAQGYRFVKSEA